MATQIPGARVASHCDAEADHDVAHDAQLDERLDAELEQTFPASDPVAVTSRCRSARQDTRRIEP